MRTTLAPVLLAACTISGWPLASDAAIVEYQYTGVIVDIADSQSVGLPIGALDQDIFSLTMTVDLETPDSDPLNPGRGYYFSAVTAWSFSTGGQSISVIPDISANSAGTFFAGPGIWIDDNNPAIGYDNCSVAYAHPFCQPRDYFTVSAAGWEAGSSENILELLLSFWDLSTFSKFDSDLLPAVQPDVRLWGQPILTIQRITPGGRSSVSGFALSPDDLPVVPIAPAAWLFGSALGVMGMTRRRLTI